MAGWTLPAFKMPCIPLKMESNFSTPFTALLQEVLPRQPDSGPERWYAATPDNIANPHRLQGSHPYG